MSQFDVAVIGAGPGGYVAAIRAAQLGGRVAIIEREELGGVCLNWGCIPTKTLIYTAELYRKMKDAADYGLTVTGLSVDLAALRKRKNDVVRKNKAGVQNLLKSNGVQVIRGNAKVLKPGVIQVGDERITVKSIIVATGSSPAQIPGLETDGKQVITSTEALELTTIPSRIAVIGAGALGAEFACIWNAFGAEITLIEMLPNVLPREDIELTTKLETVFKKRGIHVCTATKVAQLDRKPKSLTLRLDGKHAGDVEVDMILVGIGRKYHSDVFAQEAGVKLGSRGEVLVDNRMQTSVPGVYAIGDVTAKTLLAHGASTEGLVAAENAMGGSKRMDYRVVPACTFTSPEVASVGLTEQAAKDQGYEVRVGRFPFAASGRAHAMGETDGLVKIVGDVKTDEVLGVHIMGAEAGELIASAALAMAMEATVEEIAHTIHTHPTLSEAVMEAAEDYLGVGVHTPPRKSR